MPQKAASIESGIATATTNPARKSPSSRNTTATTRMAPSQRLLSHPVVVT